MASLAQGRNRHDCAADAMTGHGVPTVAVVICAYTEDRWNEMMASVGSATQQTHRAAEIILVIDHNPVLLRRATFELPGVRVIPNENEKGLSGARNTGVEAGTADIVAFLDDDAFAATNWIEALLAPYVDPNVLGVGGRVIPLWHSGRPSWFPPEFDWVVGCTYRGMPEGRAPVRNLIGANMSLRRELLLECGGFDVSLGRIGLRPTGCEETELCIRVQRIHPHGVHLYEPAAVVRHGVPDSRSTWSYFRARCFSEGLSKAIVSRLAGSERALSAEMTYVRSVIPRGVTTAMAAALRGDRSAAATALALSAGVAITGAGYVVGLRRLAALGLVGHRRVLSPNAHRQPERRSQPQPHKPLSVTCLADPGAARATRHNKGIQL